MVDTVKDGLYGYTVSVAMPNGGVSDGFVRYSGLMPNQAMSTSGGGAIAPTTAVTPVVRNLPTIWNGTAYALQASVTAAGANGDNVPATATVPVSGANAGIVSVNSGAALASSLVAKAIPGNLYGFNAVATVAGYLMFFDASAAPADGAVTPVRCIAMAAGTAVNSDRDIPIRFTTGIVMVFSSTGPLTKTASATAFLVADVK